MTSSALRARKNHVLFNRRRRTGPRLSAAASDIREVEVQIREDFLDTSVPTAVLHISLRDPLNVH